MSTQIKLDWQTHHFPAATHVANDDVVTYFVAAPEMDLDDVATAFLCGYGGDGEIEFDVLEIATADAARFTGRKNEAANRE